MIAEIIPLIRLPRSQKYYDYEIPANLKLKTGHIVDIPFRNRNISGLVNKVKKTSLVNEHKLKIINGLIYKEPYLSKNHIVIINKLAEFYLSSPSLFAKQFLSEKPKLYHSYNDETPHSKNIELLKIPNKLINFIKSKRSKKLLIYHHKSYIKYLVTIFLKKVLSYNGQHLIIFPDNKRLSDFLQSFPNKYINDVAVIHSGLNKNKSYKLYNNIQSGKIKYIVGTKKALFTPYKNLQTIWLIDEDDVSHKNYDQNPRYHARHVCQLLKDKFRSEIIYTSASPSLEIWDIFRKDKNNIMQVGKLPPIISIDQSTATGNDKLISPSIQGMINDGKKNNILLYVNKKGAGTAFKCHDCNFLYKCANCDNILVKSKKDTLLCKNCNSKSIINDTCPNCHSTNIKDVGLTTNRLKKVLLNINPLLKVNELNKDSSNNDFAGITIGTEYVFSINKRFTVGVVISLDQLLTAPSYDAEFRAWQILNRLGNICDKLIIQTINLDHIILRSLSVMNWNELYKYIWQQRNHWRYPPNWRVIKLMYRNIDKHEARDEVNSVYKKLKNDFPSLDLLEPFPLRPFKRTNKYGYGFVIRYPLKQNNSKYNITDYINDYWQVDVDPLSI
ncbi:hypothetical protein ACFL04_03885 [Patescibacteria group bacterium]